MKKIAFVLVLIPALALLALVERHRILVYAIASDEAPPLLDAQDEGPGVRWHDDYFTIQALGPRSFAIGEPRYPQQNFNYLIIGSERALLFDAGPGRRDIRPVVAALTDRPITFVPSHFHYDHIGNQVTFERVAVVDLPYLRERAQDGWLRLTWSEHLGAAEGIEAPSLRVDEWLAPGSFVSLGDRRLQVLHTPGHTRDSISLLDPDAGLLFSGDFLYEGPLYAFLPNSGMGDYLRGAQAVLESAAPKTELRVFGAHRVAPPGAPELTLRDVEELRTRLEAIRDGEVQGEGIYPVTYRVNARVELLAEPRWLQRWERR